MVKGSNEAHTNAVAGILQANNKDICAKVSAHTANLVSMIHESLNNRIYELEQNKIGRVKPDEDGH
eukprot:9443445-Karenia_brevis.AAC.1